MKQLLILFVLLFALSLTDSALAQGFKSLTKDYVVSIPEKIQNPVLDPLPAGTYSAGTGGYFSTIQAAFDKLSTDGIAGEVILELTDNLYTAPAVQFGFLLNGPISGAGPTSRVTVKPAQNKNVTIEGNNESLLYLINTSYVTFDGVSLTGPTTLTIHSLQNSAYVFNDALDFINNSDHNIIQNITFVVDDNLRASGSGFWHNQTGAFAPDSNLIQNNYVKKAGLAFFVISPTSAVKGMSNIVRGNQIGSETDSLVAFGIQVGRCENALVENNIVQNLKATINRTDQVQTGILSTISSGTIIRNNILGNFRANNGYSTSGIFLGGEAGNIGSDNMVYNNMIYDIQSISAQNDSRVTGIETWYQNNPKIYYNSVYLSGSGSQKLGSAALYIGGGNTQIVAKNNILVNTRDEGQYCASTIYSYTSASLNSDYNDLFFDNTNNNNCLVRIGGTHYPTLADWQATGKDFHSLSLMPCFCSPALHIDCTIATCLESRGTPITGLDTDFDGDLRHAYLPDIGADEFAGLIPTGAVSEGAYSVGTNGFFSSIETIFNKLETDGVAGNVTLELIDELYTAPTDSFGFKLNGPIPGAGPNSRVTIKPAENKNVTIEGNGLIVMSFNNSSFITIDGNDLSGNSTLTFHAGYNDQFSWNRCLDFWNNSDHNIVQNITFISDDYTRYGGGPGFYTRQGYTVTPDSNLIQNNFIKKAGWAIYVASSNILTRATGNIIRGNSIGSETDSLINWGIQVENGRNTIIENNIVQSIKVLNTVGDQIILGINSYSGDGDIIRNNVVHSLKASGGYSAVGILLSGGPNGSNNLVYNNIVYDIQSTSTQGNSRVAGIEIWNQEYPKIYYNTVYLSGTGNGANPLGSAALYIYGGFSGSPGVDLKNNIFVNTRDESPYCASAIYDYNIYNLSSDYNDLYYDDTNPNNCLVRIGTTDYHTLADWQATGKDVHSYVEMPHFISSTDLHIDKTIATYLESRGTPIAEVLTDIDGDFRDDDSTDIGADEFDGIVGVEDEEKLPTEFVLEQNFPNPFNPSTTFRYSIPTLSKVVIKVYDILGNEIATLMDEEKSVGAYELTWDAADLPSGVYFYQLKAGEYVNTKKMILLK